MLPTPTPYSSASSGMVAPWPLAVTIGNDPLLPGIKSLGASKLLALLSGSLDTFVRPLADQAALELSDAAHDG